MFKRTLQELLTLSARRSYASLLIGAMAFFSVSVNAEIIDGEELKDPTRPSDVPMVSSEADASFLAGLFGSASSLLSTNYKVSFIRAGGTEPVAMINEKLVRTGDTIDNAVVVAIDADSVSLRINGGIQRVASFNNTVKSPAENP